MTLFSRDVTRDDPARDAERWFSRGNNRPKIGECGVCGCDICGKDDYFEEDDAYQFDDGALVCDDCLVDYCRKHFKI